MGRTVLLFVACAIAIAAPARAMEPYVLSSLRGDEQVRIALKVDASGGERIDEVRIKLETRDGAPLTWDMQLDDGRRVIVADIDPGDYDVSVSARGYDTAHRRITVRRGMRTQAIDLNVRLWRLVMASRPPGRPPTASPPPAPPPPRASLPGDGMPAPRPPGGPHAGDDDYGIVRVFYATNRNATGDDDPGKAYGRQLVPDVSYGTAFVSIPKDHQFGRLERPSVWRLHLRENSKKDVVLQRVEPCDSSTFFVRVQEEASELPSPRLLLYVHGFNVDFPGAMRRAGQMAYDLDVRAVPIAFSWPSLGDPGAYLADEATVEIAAKKVRNFVLALYRNTGVPDIDVIAHSMGARAIGYALESLAHESELAVAPIINEMIFAAPDVDQRRMADWLDTFSPLIRRVTIYGSARDRAMWASDALHRYPRAGEGGARVFVHPPAETIDASAVGTTDFIVHGQPGDGTAITSDAFYVLRHMTPADRHALRRIERNGRTHWVMVGRTH